MAVEVRVRVVEIFIAVLPFCCFVARGSRAARWNDMAAGAIRRIVPNDEQDLPAPEEGYVEGLWKGAVRRVSGYTTKQLRYSPPEVGCWIHSDPGDPFLSCCRPDR